VGIGGFRGFGSYSLLKLYETYTPNVHSIISIISSSSPLSILSRGGAIIGGIYDIGLKGALEGYIGLLLNAPYKIDRMMG
jgi:hypothetical protein